MGLDWHLQNTEMTPRQYVASIMNMEPGADEGVVDYLMEESRWQHYRIFSELRNTDLSREEVEMVVNRSKLHFVEAWAEKESYPKDAVAWVTGICCSDFDFRGKAVALNRLVDHPDSCYENMSPKRMVEFGEFLWVKVTRELEKSGIQIPTTEDGIMSIKDKDYDTYVLARAAKWLIFWGSGGFSMNVSY